MMIAIARCRRRRNMLAVIVGRMVVRSGNGSSSRRPGRSAGSRRRANVDDDGAVVAATRRDLALLPDDLAGSALAASALVMAEGLDGPSSLTSKTMAQSRLQEAMDRLRELAPPEEKKGRVHDIKSGRALRLASSGDQQPRVSWVPPYASSTGPEAVDLARLAGIELDPWQQSALSHGLGESSDWKCPFCVHRTAGRVECPDHPDATLIHPWSAFEVTTVVPRQNGKSELLIARMLAGLFILEEPLQIYSAHQFDTAMEVFLRLVAVVDNTPELSSLVKLNRGKVGIYSHGWRESTLTCGARIRFKARTGGGGRGFSCDCLYLDEAMILPERFLGATVPTLSARANPQIWLAGSAPDEDEPTHDGVVAGEAACCERRRAGLLYFEHSAEWRASVFGRRRGCWTIRSSGLSQSGALGFGSLLSMWRMSVGDGRPSVCC